MMCFLIFCNHRPNTKQIFQFTEGVVGKLESKTWKNADKNSISVSKSGENTDKNSIFAEHIALIAWFDPKTMKNT